jgi:23S rRNA (guanosine2251-2'-O)-methyltransferase
MRDSSDRRIVVLLDNIRSLYNTGSILRTADASGVERVVLCGITPRPDQGSRQRRAIAKTALGAEDTVRWEYQPDTHAALQSLAAAGYHIAAVETSSDAVNLFEWTPRWPVCLVFGHEVDGVSSSLDAHVETVIRIPMLGQKRSLNVATAAGVVLYELLRLRLYGSRT